MKNVYYINHMVPGSVSLGNQVKLKIEGTYQDAVDEAHRLFESFAKKVNVTVHGDKYCLYYYHAIWAKGQVEDRNFNSGVTFKKEYDIKYVDGYVSA